jgi:hypothetical protein
MLYRRLQENVLNNFGFKRITNVQTNNYVAQTQYQQ